MLPRILILLFASLTALRAADYRSFSTAGHAKAQGVSISVDYPATWVGRENAQPGVVHEFRDPSTGGRDALIVVIPATQPTNATARDFRRSFELPEAQEQVVPKARHRKKAFVEGLPYPCVALDYDMEAPQLAPAVAQVRNYILLVEGKMVQIQFYGVAPANEDLRATRQQMMDRIIRSIKKV